MIFEWKQCLLLASNVELPEWIIVIRLFSVGVKKRNFCRIADKKHDFKQLV